MGDKITLCSAFFSCWSFLSASQLDGEAVPSWLADNSWHSRQLLSAGSGGLLVFRRILSLCGNQSLFDHYSIFEDQRLQAGLIIVINGFTVVNDTKYKRHHQTDHTNCSTISKFVKLKCIQIGVDG